MGLLLFLCYVNMEEKKIELSQSYRRKHNWQLENILL